MKIPSKHFCFSGLYTFNMSLLDFKTKLHAFNNLFLSFSSTKHSSAEHLLALALLHLQSLNALKHVSVEGVLSRKSVHLKTVEPSPLMIPVVLVPPAKAENTVCINSVLALVYLSRPFFCFLLGFC